MKIIQILLKSKLIVAAIISIAKTLAKELDVDINAPMTQIIEQLGVNRTYMYEVRDRVLVALKQAAMSTRGRPASQAIEAPEREAAMLQLKIDVLHYRLQHPGAVCEGCGRDTYSDAFKYFILNRYDKEQEQLTQQRFAQAAEIPLETLRSWLSQDRAPVLASLETPHAPEAPEIPVDAPEIVHQIASLHKQWQGSTRAFLRYAGEVLGLKTCQVARVMQIIRLLPLPKRKNFRYRGSTQKLAPGTMLVTDGKKLSIHLTGTHRDIKLNWQAMVDQTTGTNTGSAITPNENADGVWQAFEASLRFMGGQPPQAILCDNKPCYDDVRLNEKIKPICDVIKATPGRAQNKAILEGTFSLFEQRVGTIRLHDSSKAQLIESATSEIIRAYTAATNDVPCAQFDGKSRRQALDECVPDPRQEAKDQAFLRRLKAQHQRPFRRQPQTNRRSRELLDAAFTRFGLLEKDTNGTLRAFLSEFEPAAIKTASAIFHARQARGKINPQWAHRYLTKLILNMQQEIDLQRCEQELLNMNRQEAQNWTREQQALYDQLRAQTTNIKDLCCSVAEKAAESEMPVAAAFWHEKLRALLIKAKELIPSVRTHVRRLYWANLNIRLLLINELAELEYGLRTP